MKVRVTSVGHIRKSLGKETLDLDGDGLTAGKVIELAREIASREGAPGFTKFNTLVVVNGESAFTAAAEDRSLADGDEVLLLPFSHGG